MRGVFEQFYRTWCYAGRSVSGADGWKIRAKSAGLPLPEAEGMADLANYWVPTRLNALTPPGTRLALFRPSPTQAVLVHGVLRPGLVGGRAGVSFEHVIAHLPPAFSAFEAIRLWHSPAWQLDDGDFQPTLGPFLWDDQLRGPESRTDSPNSDAIASAQPEDTASWEDTLAARHLDQYPALPWAHALQACLALGQQRVERLFIAGQDDAIARLLYVVFYCLPDAFRDRLTFSTHENPKGTKGVKIVGVTTFEGEDSDLPSFCYEGQYRALNLFTDRRSDALDLGPFAASAIDWLRCGQYAYLHRVRAQFNELDPADNPGARELDLLSQEVECGEEASGKPKFLLNLCSSRALARSRIIRPDQLASFLACARAEPTFESRLAGELSAWLPGNAPAARAVLGHDGSTRLRRVERGISPRCLGANRAFCPTSGASFRRPVPGAALSTLPVRPGRPGASSHRNPLAPPGNLAAPVISCRPANSLSSPKTSTRNRLAYPGEGRALARGGPLGPG